MSDKCKTDNSLSGSPREINKNNTNVNVRSCYCPSKAESADYIEDVVCKEEDIQENEMKLLPLGSDGGKILLIKQQGELHAIGTKCTHYGALLNTGALGEGRVRCPWHGACFNIKTGDIEDYPGLDSLPCYKVSIFNGQVKVKAKRSELKANKRTKAMCGFKVDHPETVVIIGGGPSAATCAETLRQENYEGRIIMVCKEKVLPYDRVKVSKVMDFDVQKALLRPQSFYDQNKIETKLGVEAIKLDTEKQIVTLSNCEVLNYTYLYIATGSKARRPDVPGADLKNSFIMRTYTDSENVYKSLASDKHVVILGLGFIGLEAAAYCVDKVASVTVIGRDTIPFRVVFGEEIGCRVKKEFEDKGIKFVSKQNICKLIPKDDDPGVVGQVMLSDKTVLPADIVIFGVGSTLYTNWLKGSRVKLRDDGCVEVDDYLSTNVKNVYAGGDIAHAPVHCAGVSASIGHYALAHYHGKIAAMNICKKNTPLKAVPFFWTTLFGKSYRYAGYGKPSNIKVHGSLADFKFFAYYFKDGKVVAMSSVGRDPIVSDFANMLYEGKTLTEEEVENDPIKWIRNKPKDLQVTQTPVQDIKSNTRPFQHRGHHTLAMQRISLNNSPNIKLLKYSIIVFNLHRLLLH
ncbi:apoptosis-inducing factor 3-like isoform X2 [Phymastichus coffea]|uniref:apoptosis-inducing factor 3-like isoform X2 n=1 Tax=Phymastichus coffea TaxID=108790 RepID=UPI00273C560A|nr:apoptosis-inducing factor 3-like isoform X2 [Phymastichus coffea]XP_058797476.1 apoptosis-inducing factor 3-like isoform X2 [Phymastichus coffea]